MERKAIIESGIPALRDPCVLENNGILYVYGTGWTCSKNETGDLSSGWESLKNVVITPEHAVKDHWAPEVHKYGGKFYMITTYFSDVTNHRGCTVMCADDPMGPFTEISNGHVTPADWDAIDGTLYTDKNGKPWMVFVHEWTCRPDHVGTFACAPLSDDLTHFIAEPTELFRADSAPWSRNGVTDGCWMYTTENGSLLMIWSNWDDYGYCVGVARSTTGEITGPWIHEDEVLYSKKFTGVYDGGHGMIFTYKDQMYLSIHSPNSRAAGRGEMPVFVPIKEENDTLVWDTI